MSRTRHSFCCLGESVNRSCLCVQRVRDTPTVRGIPQSQQQQNLRAASGQPNLESISARPGGNDGFGCRAVGHCRISRGWAAFAVGKDGFVGDPKTKHAATVSYFLPISNCHAGKGFTKGLS